MPRLGRAMSPTPRPFAAAGSQRWLQVAVANHPALLQSVLLEAGAIAPDERTEWTAPLASDGFAEPRDAVALRKAGIASLPVRSLSEFWPKGGPVWDAVAKVGRGGSLFVEAKAHVAEAASPASKATPVSLARIEAALVEARGFFAPDSSADWHRVFYQYANRLAHQYLFKHVNHIDSRLVFLYFLNAVDVRGPASVAEWEATTKLIHAALGLPDDLRAYGVYHAYMNVEDLKPVGATIALLPDTRGSPGVRS